MSVSAMTNVAVARRDDDLGKVDDKPRTRSQTARATADDPRTASTATAALKSIATYIPTEVITLYVAILAALAPSNPSRPSARAEITSTGGTVASSADLVAFWIFVALTPVVVWVVYATKVKNADGRLPSSPSKWPWWEMVSATVAFVAWAYAMPDSVFTRFDWYTAAIGSVIVLSVSTALGLLAPLFQRRLPT
ncbi:MAG: hypothetical protein WD556_07615 [Actinomycetota bacterium]